MTGSRNLSASFSQSNNHTDAISLDIAHNNNLVSQVQKSSLTTSTIIPLPQVASTAAALLQKNILRLPYHIPLRNQQFSKVDIIHLV